MKMISRLIMVGAFTLLVLSSACNLPAQPPVIASATLPVTEQPTNTAAPTNTVTPAPAIPITGMDVVSLQCQFCVNEEAHAVLIMSNRAFFDVSDPTTGVTCLSAQEVNGRRILLCRGAQQASFNLNVCVDNANCLQFPVTLQPCPLAGTGTPTIVRTFIPILLTPISASSTPEPENTIVPTAASTTGTPAPPLTETPIPSSPVPTTGTTPPPSSPEPTSATESTSIGKPSQSPES